MNHRMRSAVVLLGIIAATGCAHGKLPGTEVDDTEENRQILSLVEAYQKAMESLDADAVLALVSPNYYEDNATASTEDDYDYQMLHDNLVRDFQRTKKMKVEFRVDDIQVDSNKGYAELYYRIRAQNEYPSGKKWEVTSDRTRLLFEMVRGRWKIVAGL